MGQPTQHFTVVLTVHAAGGARQDFATFPFRHEASEHFRMLVKKRGLMQLPVAPATKRAGREAYATGFGGGVTCSLERVTLPVITPES